MAGSYKDAEYEETNKEFESWLMNTKSATHPHFPLMTEFLISVCGKKHNCFFTGLDILKLAFEAGQKSERKKSDA